MEALATSALRPALELAWAVARAGADAMPPVPAPSLLRPLLRFARLPERALDTVRVTLDAEPAFRARVAGVADPDALGRIPWLWLSRPDGWDDELTTAVTAAAEAAATAGAERAERAATRRLPVVEGRLAALEAELEVVRARLARAGDELGAERADRRRTEADVAGLGRLLDEARRERAEAAAQAEVAASRVAAAASAVGAAERDTAAAERRAALAQAEIEALRRGLHERTERLQRAEQQAVATARTEAERAGALAGSVAEAAEAAGRLGVALAGAAELLEGRGAAPGTPASRDGHDRIGHAPRALPGRNPAVVIAQGPHPRPGPSRGGSRRRPVALPGGIWDDSVDAALHLLRTPGAVVLVDGYNVTLSVWPGSALGEQRHRLVTALAEAALRTGAVVEVVFDGAGDAISVVAGPGGRDPVRVVFSPAGVDADDVIIERAVRLPATCPVVVATDDRRVRDAVAAVGANVIGSGQLVEAIGRSTGRAG